MEREGIKGGGGGSRGGGDQGGGGDQRGGGDQGGDGIKGGSVHITSHGFPIGLYQTVVLSIVILYV